MSGSSFSPFGSGPEFRWRFGGARDASDIRGVYDEDLEMLVRQGQGSLGALGATLKVVGFFAFMLVGGLVFSLVVPDYYEGRWTLFLIGIMAACGGGLWIVRRRAESHFADCAEQLGIPHAEAVRYFNAHWDQTDASD